MRTKIKKLVFIFVSFFLMPNITLMQARNIEDVRVLQKQSTRVDIGRWQVTIKSGAKITYTITIYRKDNSFYAYLNYGKTNDTQRLRKKGNKYYVIGGDFGEYYIVNEKQLKIGDQDGIIDEATTKKL